MSLSESFRVCFTQKFASCEGRASRSEFWWFELCMILCIYGPILFFGLLAAATGNDDLFGVAGVLMTLAFLAFVIPAFCVRVRRLHDVGHSGWFQLVACIPYVGYIILLIVLAEASKMGTNEYGDPVE